MIGALADRYTVLQELGRGGMATVYLADDRRHGRQVALKLLRPELGAMLGPDRFTREIRVAAALNHPHILPLYDSGQAEDQLFYVMPYVRGGSLRQKLTAERQLSADEALGIVRQVAAALDHAHAHGLIHRDIKPENILLHEGEAMVTDFGIALAADSDPGERLTAVGVMVGTPDYMSPEQAAGERALDARSDVYSLGCVLYELLAGEPPHAATTARGVIARRFTEPPPRVRRVRPTVSAAVDEAIARALALDPADRFPTAMAFADALGGTETAPRASRPPSIAVLPFLNLSADPENEFFADGITEDVIAQLSKIRSLRVIGRGSVMRFKGREQNPREIGATLDVATLLEGSVRRAGSRVRIVSQLIDAGSDRQLWAETYDRELTDIFAIQSDVALQIAAALKAELSHEERTEIRREPTADVEAYRLYLQGRHCIQRWTEEGLDQGLRYLAKRPRAIRPMRWPMPASRTPTPTSASASRDRSPRRKPFGGQRPPPRGRSSSTPDWLKRMPCWGTSSTCATMTGRARRPSSSGPSSSTRTAATRTTSTGSCCPPRSGTTRRSRRSAAPTSSTLWRTAWTSSPRISGSAGTTRRCAASPESSRSSRISPWPT